ncbi:bacteriocin [Streptococcus suis]|uniref:Bacteriocin n=1 Tax=Streptococcus suis TaxID=1307 RepID=A0A0Z8PE09_STRSU|nr:bacteriocin [Streptococcus suis]NQG29533.1 bacteriocin [Streptococcus suis]CYW44055.1 Uncharacterised protein [Streptococcus suis]HEM5998477.1 bacteriocin [Streptococcus suis]
MRDLTKKELKSITGGGVPAILLPNNSNYKLVNWFLGLFK